MTNFEGMFGVYIRKEKTEERENLCEEEDLKAVVMAEIRRWVT